MAQSPHRQPAGATRRTAVGAARRLEGNVHAFAGMLLVVLLALALLPPWAGASEPDQGEAEELAAEEEVGVREAALPSFQGPQGLGTWFWPEGRRAYRLQLGVTQWDFLQAFDVDTGERVGTATLSPSAWSGSPNSEYISALGRRHVATVDREHGRVFVAYETLTTDAGQADAPCPGPGAFMPSCVGGVHVIDGNSMDSLGKIGLELPTVEGPRGWPILRAMEYAPPVAERGWGGQVLMVVEEYAHGPTEESILTSFNWQTTNAVMRRNGGNVAYAVAFDPESMRQEWAVRLEGCRNAREPRNWAFAQIGDPTAVFRTGGSDPALYVGCHGSSAQQGVVVRVALDEEGAPASLPVRVGDPVAEADPGAEDGGLGGLVAPAPRQEVFPGPEKVQVIMADPVSQRILMRVDDSGQVWWVFDGAVNQYLGTIGIGDYPGYSGSQSGGGATSYGLDEDSGRLYVRASAVGSAPGGLYVADIRRNPLPQALHFPHLASTSRGSDRRLWVMPRGDTGVTRIYGAGIVDERPAALDLPADDAGVVRTLDLDEAEGATEATFDGTARGFGFRAILLGGVEGATRFGPADPIGVARGLPQWEGGRSGIEGLGTATVGDVTRHMPPPDPCTDAQRELIVAFVGPESPAVVDASSARGETQPVLADTRTREDAEAPVTRCGPMEWPELWRSVLVSQPPMSEPGVAWPFADSRSSCTAADEDGDRESWSDPVAGMFASQVECSEDQVGGWGQARGLDVDGVSVANTLSSFRIYRDPQRGLVARVESIARGINIGGIVKIDTIRGAAESWANGRLASAGFDPELERELGLAADDDEEPVDDAEASSDDADGSEDDGEEFNPWNCDTDRPAGTCFERHIFGVTVTDPSSGEVAYRCGPCGDEDALIEGMNRGFGAYGMARFREPDRDLARGSADGYIAAVTKKDAERFADIVMNADLLETMVPMLEVIRYAPHNRPSAGERNASSGEFSATDFGTGTPPRGRQVYQFAAVEVSSTYSIQCLLEYDAVTNVCAEAAEPPASLSVALTDPDGDPLAGGAFEIHADTDGDGVLGLVDELADDGACVTGEDGVGECVFDGLEPGSYIVSQTAAPDGFSVAEEPFPVDLAPGDDRTVTFTNVSAVSVVDITVMDLDGAPVAGAVFGVFGANGGEPVASCATDDAGLCTLEIPPGVYVLRQMSAPDGLAPVDDIPFEIVSGGQTATVELTLGMAGGDSDPVAAGPGPVVETTPVSSFTPVISGPTFTPSDGSGEAPGPSVAERVGSTIVRVIRAPAGLMRLAARSPVEAASFAAVWALLAMAVFAVARRHQLTGLLAAPAGFPTGGPPGGPSGPSRPSGPSGPPASGSSGGSGGGPGGGSPPAPAPAPTRPAAAQSVPATAQASVHGATPVLERSAATQPAAAHAASTSAHTATAVLERPVAPPVVAGAAPKPGESLSVLVVVATESPLLAVMVTQRLAGSDTCEVVATADTLVELRRALADDPADVLVDLTLDTGTSDDICGLLPGLHPATRTVGLIPPGRSPQALAVRGYRAGLGGLLVADDDIGNGHLAYAVGAVAAGKPCYGPTVQAVLLDHWGERDRSEALPAGLSGRELQVARLTAAGATRTEIAEQLYLSPQTVKRHLRAVRTKLGVTNPRDHLQVRRRLEELGGLEGPGATTD